SFADEFGEQGETYFSVRPSRFGLKTDVPTSLGTLKTVFEYELFGVGPQAGQTTLGLTHAHGEPGPVGAGPTPSALMGPPRVPPLARVLGAERHGLLPQRAGALDAAQGRQPADPRSRAAGRQRRPGTLQQRARAGRHHRPLPAARPDGPGPPRRRLGPRAARG